MWLPAVPCVQAQGQSASKPVVSGNSSGSSKKGTAAKPGTLKPAAPKKTAAKSSPTAKAPGSKEKGQPKAVVKVPAKPAPGKDKALTTAKKSKPAAPAAGKSPGKTVAANSKTLAKPSVKPAKSAPDKTQASAGTKKKSKPADNAPPAKTAGAGTVAAGKKTGAGKGRSLASSGLVQTASNFTNADGDRNDAGADSPNHDMFASRVFVPADLGQRFFGMPTGLPSALTFVSLMVDSTAPRTFSASNPDVAPPKRPVAPIDAMTARAAMAASAKKQSTFRPAPASVSDKFSLPDDKPGPLPASVGSDRRQAADFVTKAAPLSPAMPSDDFSGLGDFLHSRTASLTLKGGPDGAPGSAGDAGRDAGKTVVANPSARQGGNKPEAVKPPATAAASAPPVPARTAAPVLVAVQAPTAPATIPVFLKPGGNAASSSSPAARPPAQREEVFARSLALAATRVSENPQLESAAEPVLSRSMPTSAVLPLRVENTVMEKLPESLPAFDEPAIGSVDIQSAGRTEHDQKNNKVIYTGRVELNDKVVHLRGDRVEVFLKKTGNGIERLEASGHVMLRAQAGQPGSARMVSAGRVIYRPATGEITLREKPEVREGGKGGRAHVSTSPSTVMVIKSDGRILTEGPNRTIIAN
ncbi:MAG: hypothetical protein JWM59_1695 [Verrucomicrobiales bacterium]|nr:hypothetical protein [Verrucomicrobiales bacterium]